MLYLPPSWDFPQGIVWLVSFNILYYWFPGDNVKYLWQLYHTSRSITFPVKNLSSRLTHRDAFPLLREGKLGLTVALLTVDLRLEFDLTVFFKRSFFEYLHFVHILSTINQASRISSHSSKHKSLMLKKGAVPQPPSAFWSLTLLPILPDFGQFTHSMQFEKYT